MKMSETTVKTCIKCNGTKPTTAFSKASGNADGLQYWCKECTNTWRKFNKTKVNEYARNWIARKKAEDPNWKPVTKEKLTEYQHTYYLKNVEKIKYRTLLSQRKLKKDPFKRMLANIRVLITFSIPEEHRNLSTLELVGCSKEYLKKHIESQFVGEMSWDNYGSVWVVDHIVPRIRFNMADPEEQKTAFGFENMQPLFTEQNRTKHARVIPNKKSCIILDKLAKIRFVAA